MIERIRCSETAMITNPKEHGAIAKPMVAAARMSGMSTSPAPRSGISVFDVDESTNFSSLSAPAYRRTKQSGLMGSGGNLRLIYGGSLRFARAESGADRLT